jgi:CO/xanthine dehydrogenase FAD-binding subunit
MVKHFIPNTLEEALEILHTEQVEIIAGGTDLMVQRRNWADTRPTFKQTMNIMSVEELRYIKKVDDNLHIGALTSLTDILDNKDTPELLKKSIYEIASPALRNVATIAGNIVNASPAADTVPILYALDAIVEITSKDKVKKVPVEEVILGPRKTIMKSNQLITEIIIPLEPFTKTKWVKVGGRKADAISKLSFAGAVKLEKDIIKDIRIVFGAVAPVMVRSKELEKTIINRNKTELTEMIHQIIDDYSDLIKPIDDQRSNKEYRKHVSLNLLLDFLLNL